MSHFFLKKYSIIPVILFSAALYYFSTGLSGDYWFLLWIAPVPLLIYGFYNTKAAAFFAALIAIVLSKINIFFFLSNQIFFPAIAVIMIFFWALIFACIFLLNKILISKIKNPLRILIFPVLTMVVEFIMSITFPDGTWGSLAYTQANNVILIQIASITGIYGITFTISLFASLSAFLLTLKDQKIRFSDLIFPSVILIIIFIFGILRIANIRENVNNEDQNLRYFNVLCLDVEHLPAHSNINNPKNRDLVIHMYDELIDKSNSQNLDCILLPEKITELKQDEKTAYYSNFSALTVKNNCLIVAGWKIKNNPDKNIASVFLPNDETFFEYQKKYLVGGWERTFGRGNSILIFDYKKLKLGVAICKDMDFPGWIRKYSTADILLVPAWDFQIDNWQHSRMAVMRGVENGFTVIRSAREGDQTISDPYGRIVKESTFKIDNNENFLTAGFRVKKINTFYSKYGNWFCWLNLLIVCVTILYLIIKQILNQTLKNPD